MLLLPPFSSWRHPNGINFWGPLQLYLPGTLVTLYSETRLMSPLLKIDSTRGRKVPEYLRVEATILERFSRGLQRPEEGD